MEKFGKICVYTASKSPSLEQLERNKLQALGVCYGLALILESLDVGVLTYFKPIFLIMREEGDVANQIFWARCS